MIGKTTVVWRLTALTAIVMVSGVFAATPSGAAELDQRAATETLALSSTAHAARGEAMTAAEAKAAFGSAASGESCWGWEKEWSYSRLIYRYKFEQILQWCASGGKVTRYRYSQCMGYPLLAVRYYGCSRRGTPLPASYGQVNVVWTFRGYAGPTTVSFTPRTSVRVFPNGTITGTVVTS